MNDVNSISFYVSFYQGINRLKKPAQKLKMYEAITAYAFEDKIPTFKDEVSKLIWDLIQPNINTSKGRSRASLLRSKSETNDKQTDNKPEANQEQTGSKSRANKNQSTVDRSMNREEGNREEGNIKREVVEKVCTTPKGVKSARASRPSHFIKPTVDEVRALCKEKGYHFDPEAFIAYYESNGWRVGRNPIKSWQMACVTWERRERADHPEITREETPKKNPEPITKCIKCGSTNIRMRHDYGICSDCGNGFDWDYKNGGWKIHE